MKKVLKQKHILLSVVLVVIAVVIGLASWQLEEKHTRDAFKTTAADQQILNKWSTYTNPVFDYSVQYPSTDKVIDTDPSKLVLTRTTGERSEKQTIIIQAGSIGEADNPEKIRDEELAQRGLTKSQVQLAEAFITPNLIESERILLPSTNELGINLLFTFVAHNKRMVISANDSNPDLLYFLKGVTFTD